MKRFSLVACSLLLVAATSAYAELKVGVVNIDEVAQKAPLAMTYNSKISAQFKPRQDALNSAQQKLQDDMDKLNYSSYQMTIAERTQLQTTIVNEKRDFETTSLALQKDLVATQAQYTQALMAKLNAVIAKIAQDGKYDMIQTSANMLFLNNTINLTPKVIEELK